MLEDKVAPVGVRPRGLGVNEVPRVVGMDYAGAVRGVLQGAVSDPDALKSVLARYDDLLRHGVTVYDLVQMTRTEPEGVIEWVNSRWEENGHE